MPADTSKPIPPTTVEFLLKVQHAKARDPSLDLRCAIQTALKGVTNEQMVNTASRLIALTNLLLVQPELPHKPTEAGSVVHVSIFRAAARAPLFQTERPALLLFELDSFLKVLAEESDPSPEA